MSLQFDVTSWHLIRQGTTIGTGVFGPLPIQPQRVLDNTYGTVIDGQGATIFVKQTYAWFNAAANAFCTGDVDANGVVRNGNVDLDLSPPLGYMQLTNTERDTLWAPRDSVTEVVDSTGYGGTAQPGDDCIIYDPSCDYTDGSGGGGGGGGTTSYEICVYYDSGTSDADGEIYVLDYCYWT